jgi:hypothetical protein
MIIIGVDYHPAFQQIALLDTETGESQEKRLGHREEGHRQWRPQIGKGSITRRGFLEVGPGDWRVHDLSAMRTLQHRHSVAKAQCKRRAQTPVRGPAKLGLEDHLGLSRMSRWSLR